MMKATLKINGERDFIIEDELVTIGRASDNKISFAEDSNVSRYHAEIENRDGEFWLIELGSSNGTTVNGEPLETEMRLQDGDLILFGGTSELEFSFAEEKLAAGEESSSASAINPGSAGLSSGASGAESAAAVVSGGADGAAKSSGMLIVMGITCGLALICIIAVVVYSSGILETKCEAKAVITSPESGDVINKETEVTVDAQNTECVNRAVFLIDGAEIASADTAPYTTKLDPKQFPDLADGGNHSLEIVLVDEKGNRIGPS
jgi:pSer/pThr/pTyr-binding forkhead associated (FHA) protein